MSQISSLLGLDLAFSNQTRFFLWKNPLEGVQSNSPYLKAKMPFQSVNYSIVNLEINFLTYLIEFSSRLYKYIWIIITKNGCSMVRLIWRKGWGHPTLFLRNYLLIVGGDGIAIFRCVPTNSSCSVASSNLMFTPMVLLQLNGSQNKTKGHACQRGTGRDGGAH